GLFGQRGNAIEPYVCQDCDGCASEEPRIGECLWIIERARKEQRVTVRVAKNVASRCHEYDHDNSAHGRSHPRINARGCFDAAYVQQRKDAREEYLPSPLQEAWAHAVG